MPPIVEAANREQIDQLVIDQTYFLKSLVRRVLKFDPYHDPHTGKFTSGGVHGGGGEAKAPEGDHPGAHLTPGQHVTYHSGSKGDLEATILNPHHPSGKVHLLIAGSKHGVVVPAHKIEPKAEPKVESELHKPSAEPATGPKAGGELYHGAKVIYTPKGGAKGGQTLTGTYLGKTESGKAKIHFVGSSHPVSNIPHEAVKLHPDEVKGHGVEPHFTESDKELHTEAQKQNPIGSHVEGVKVGPNAETLPKLAGGEYQHASGVVVSHKMIGHEEGLGGTPGYASHIIEIKTPTGETTHIGAFSAKQVEPTATPTKEFKNGDKVAYTPQHVSPISSGINQPMQGEVKGKVAGSFGEHYVVDFPGQPNIKIHKDNLTLKSDQPAPPTHEHPVGSEVAIHAGPNGEGNLIGFATVTGHAANGGYNVKYHSTGVETQLHAVSVKGVKTYDTVSKQFPVGTKVKHVDGLSTTDYTVTGHTENGNVTVGTDIGTSHIYSPKELVKAGPVKDGGGYAAVSSTNKPLEVGQKVAVDDGAGNFVHGLVAGNGAGIGAVKVKFPEGIMGSSQGHVMDVMTSHIHDQTRVAANPGTVEVGSKGHYKNFDDVYPGDKVTHGGQMATVTGKSSDHIQIKYDKTGKQFEIAKKTFEAKLKPVGKQTVGETKTASPEFKEGETVIYPFSGMKGHVLASVVKGKPGHVMVSWENGKSDVIHKDQLVSEEGHPEVTAPKISGNKVMQGAELKPGDDVHAVISGNHQGNGKVTSVNGDAVGVSWDNGNHTTVDIKAWSGSETGSGIFHGKAGEGPKLKVGDKVDNLTDLEPGQVIHSYIHGNAGSPAKVLSVDKAAGTITYQIKGAANTSTLTQADWNAHKNSGTALVVTAEPEGMGGPKIPEGLKEGEPVTATFTGQEGKYHGIYKGNGFVETSHVGTGKADTIEAGFHEGAKKLAGHTDGTQTDSQGFYAGSKSALIGEHVTYKAPGEKGPSSIYHGTVAKVNGDGTISVAFTHNSSGGEIGADKAGLIQEGVKGLSSSVLKPQPTSLKDFVEGKKSAPASGSGYVSHATGGNTIETYKHSPPVTNPNKYEGPHPTELGYKVLTSEPDKASEFAAWKESYNSWHTAVKGASSELAGLHSYTGSGYRTTNDTLRKGGTPHLAASLDKAFARTSLPEKMVTFRGAGSNHQLLTQFANLKPGDTWVDNAYMSSSPLIEKSWPGVKLELHLPKGARGGWVSNGISSVGNHEQEFIVGRGNTFIYKGQRENGFHVLELVQQHGATLEG